MNPRIYQLGAFGDEAMSGLRDVISGNNTFNGVPGFNATLGYDRTTGWGTVDVQTFEAQYLSSAIPQPPTPTATPTPNTSITFVGAGPLADSSTAVSSLAISRPSGVQPGDTMIAQIVIYDGTGSDVPTAPGGWTGIRHDSANSNGNQENISSWLYYKVAGASEPASYAWNLSSNFAAGAMGAWRGASTTAPIDVASGAATGGLSPISESAPSLTPNNNNELQTFFYGAQAASAPAITPSSSLNQRFNLGSSKEGFALAFADLPPRLRVPGRRSTRPRRISPRKIR